MNTKMLGILIGTASFVYALTQQKPWGIIIGIAGLSLAALTAREAHTISQMEKLDESKNRPTSIQV